jgi:hypothetical protein
MRNRCYATTSCASDTNDRAHLKLYPAPIAPCRHDSIGTIKQITNDLTRLMIADISEIRAALATNQTP